MSPLRASVGSQTSLSAIRAAAAPSSSSTVTESEPVTVKGKNDSQTTAQYLKNFGSGAGNTAAIDVNGVLGPLPPAVTPREDDGSITFANVLPLTAGNTGRATATAAIGDGPNGSAGSNTGDYDFYRLAAGANQLLTIKVIATDGTLNPVVGIYNSAGTLLNQNDDEYSNPYYGSTSNSYLRFLTPAA